MDDTPNPEPAQTPAISTKTVPVSGPVSNGAPLSNPAPRVPLSNAPVPVAVTQQAPESESDDPSLPVPPKTTCKRRGCNVTTGEESHSLIQIQEDCVYHPGQALFHEGSKGWTCCKRRVLEFDEFMKIEGCKRKKHHLFVGRRKAVETEETLLSVR